MVEYQKTMKIIWVLTTYVFHNSKSFLNLSRKIDISHVQNIVWSEMQIYETYIWGTGMGTLRMRHRSGFRLRRQRGTAVGTWSHICFRQYHRSRRAGSISRGEGGSYRRWCSEGYILRKGYEDIEYRNRWIIGYTNDNIYLHIKLFAHTIFIGLRVREQEVPAHHTIHMCYTRS